MSPTASLRPITAGLITAAIALLMAVGCSNPPAVDDRSAVVLYTEGTVEADVGGAFRTVARDAVLAPENTLRTGPGAMALLGLTNGRLVKIDADVTVVVGQNVGFSAGPTTEPIAAQLASMVNAAELARMPPGEALAERVAGFQHHRRAGTSVGAQVSRDDKAEKSAAESHEVAAAAGPPVAPTAMPPPPEEPLRDETPTKDAPAKTQRAAPPPPAKPADPARQNARKKNASSDVGGNPVNTGRQGGGDGSQESANKVAAAAQVRVTVGDVIGLSKSDVERRIAGLAAGLQACPATGTPSVLKVTLTVDATGHIQKMNLEGTSSLALRTCVTTIVKDWVLPAPSAAPGTAALTIRLGPSS